MEKMKTKEKQIKQKEAFGIITWVIGFLTVVGCLTLMGITGVLYFVFTNSFTIWERIIGSLFILVMFGLVIAFIGSVATNEEK